MKIKASSLILLVFAVVLALCAAYVARSLLAPAAQTRAEIVQSTETEKEEPRVALLTTSLAVQPGDFISADALVWKNVKASEAPAGSISTVEGTRRDWEKQVIGATVRRAVEAGAALRQEWLLTAGHPGFIAAVLKPGMRAVSIPTSAVASNSGLVTAGDWVDVILTLERKSAEAMADDKDASAGLTKLAAQTILQKVRVLALNSSTAGIAPAAAPASEKKEGAGRQTRRAVYETITLEVTLEDAQRLAVAREVGELQVALRGLREGEAVASGKVRVTRIPDTTGVLGETKSAPHQVTTYQGAQAAVLSF